MIKVALLICITLFLAGCITAPDGRKGVGLALPIIVKDTDCGSIIIGWTPPDSVTSGRYGILIHDGKSYLAPIQ